MNFNKLLNLTVMSLSLGFSLPVLSEEKLIDYSMVPELEGKIIKACGDANKTKITAIFKSMESCGKSYSECLNLETFQFGVCIEKEQPPFMKCKDGEIKSRKLCWSNFLQCQRKI